MTSCERVFHKPRPRVAITRQLDLTFGDAVDEWLEALTSNHFGSRAGAVARSDVCPPGMRTVADSILTSGKTFIRGDFVMKKKIYGHPLSSADLRRAVVGYWRKNVHYVLINCLGSLPRNSVDKLTDHVRNDLKSLEG